MSALDVENSWCRQLESSNEINLSQIRFPIVIRFKEDGHVPNKSAKSSQLKPRGGHGTH